MPALACCVDATPPGYAAFFAEEGSHASSIPFSSTTTTATIAAAIENSNPLATLWTPLLSTALYCIDAWGQPYFGVNPSGNISVRPYGSRTHPCWS
ncbi:hypothetical protein SLEP1_g35102 [Rubroshorea leprosula]|nr:hypothetical protein SLEP1_g35102 [Rubroshorea leprosula]